MPGPAERLAPGRTALVVVDMQNDFCAPGGYIASALGKDVSGLATIVPPLKVLLGSAREAGVPVVWLAACYEEELIPPSMIAQKRRLGVEAVCCRKDSWGADFFGVSPAEGEPVFVKHTYSGFSNPTFERHLASHGVESLAFCGVQTNVCVESTLRDAHARGFDVAIVSDAVASHAPHMHEATLANVRFLLGDVVASADLLALWSLKDAAAA
nr:isochorismatase family cysteine hydrolase [Enterovirga sp. DB1703]